MPINVAKETGGRGRVYKCLACGYLEEKRRVIGHWYKAHKHYTEAPYYCSICLFRATKEKDLQDHVKPGVYPPHQRGIDLKHQMNQPVDEFNMLMKSHTAKYPVEGQDIACLSPEESLAIWGQRRRHSTVDRSMQRASSSENILSTLLGDYDPNERITPVPTPLASPLAPPSSNPVPVYSPQFTQGVFPRPVYHPTPLNQGIPGHRQPDMLQKVLHTSQIAVPDQSAFRPLATSIMPKALPVVTVTTDTVSAQPAQQQQREDLDLSNLLPDNLLDEALRGVPLTPEAYQGTGATPNCQDYQPGTTTRPTNNNVPPPQSRAVGVTTSMAPPPAPVEVVNLDPVDASTAPPPAPVQADPRNTSDAAVNTGDQPPTDQSELQVAKAISEMTKSLVEVISNQTFQIEMVKNTLSAFLRRLDDRDRERKFPVQHQMPHPQAIHPQGHRKVLIPKRPRRSVTPMPSPAKRKKVASTVVVPEKRNK